MCIPCLLLLPLFVGVYVCSLYCCTVLCVISSLQSSHWGRECWLPNFYCLLDVMLLLLIFVSSLRWRGWVYGV